MKKCIVVYNPVSGKEKNKEYLEDFYTVLKKNNYDFQIIYTKQKGDATNIIENLGNIDLVIVAGGDGTLSEAVRGNLVRKDRLLLGLLPLGTTNDVGKMLGYTKDYVKDLDLLLSGARQKYDVGYINNVPFVYVAALGSLTDVSYSTPRESKRKLGHLAYVLQVLKTINKKFKYFNLKYKVNGKTYQGKYSHIFITNTTNIGGKGRVYKDVKLDDHLFEVAALKIDSKIDIIKALYYILTSKIEKIPKLEFYKTSNIEILFDEEQELNWCIDGEELKINTSKVKINVNSDNTMLVPTKNIDKLFK